MFTKQDSDAIFLAHQFRTGDLTQPQPRYDNPEDYGLTRKDAINARIRYLRSMLDDAKEKLSTWNRLMIGATSNWFIYWQHNETAERVAKLEKELKYTRGRLKYKEDTPQGYDIAHIKSIPIGSLFPTNAAGFFINNPLRPEHSPSNSLHWNKAKNKWCDYASGEHGDLIDLWMKVNKCTIQEAMKELSNL